MDANILLLLKQIPKSAVYKAITPTQYQLVDTYSDRSTKQIIKTDYKITELIRFERVPWALTGQITTLTPRITTDEENKVKT